MNVTEAHAFSAHNRTALMQSGQCGCFYCLAVFAPDKITQWLGSFGEDEHGSTALCPQCGIDSVIGDADVSFDEDFLKQMHLHWFSLS